MKTSVPCAICKKPAYPDKSKLKRNKNHFCSTACYAAFKSKTMRDFPLESKIVDLYNSGISIQQIEKRVDRTEASIGSILKANNITLRPKPRKYDFQEDFFDTIDTEGKAYFLGLLFADGNNYISNDTHRISLELGEMDKHILEAFKRTISMAPNYRLSFRKKRTENSQNLLTLKLNSKYMCSILASHGCIPNKSLKLLFPTCVPHNLLKHFMRGYFDGDGCISKIKESGNHTWSITSTQNFCEEYKRILNQFVAANLHIYKASAKNKDNNITKQLVSGGNNQVYSIMAWLYKDATIFLERKHDIFLALKARRENR